MIDGEIQCNFKDCCLHGFRLYHQLEAAGLIQAPCRHRECREGCWKGRGVK